MDHYYTAEAAAVAGGPALPCLIAAALGYFLASASPNMGVAMIVLPFLLCMSLILCGFMIRTPAMPVYW